jgi:hypothetical protein
MSVRAQDHYYYDSDYYDYLLLAGERCEDNPPAQLVHGNRAQVTPGRANNLRAEPGRDAELIGRIPGGAQVTVLSAGVCLDGLVWYAVDYNDLIGWTVESFEGEYVLVTPTTLRAADVRFTLPESMAHLETITASLAATQPDYVGVWVWYEHVRTQFINPEDSTGRMWIARMEIYPVEVLVGDATYEAYLRLMDEQPDLKLITNGLPTLLRVSASMYIAADGEYVTLENARGIEYFTQFGQDWMPFNRDTLYYTFQGTTLDNAFFISLTLPVEIATLPETDDEFWYQSERQLIEGYPAYLQRVVDTIIASPDDAFTPRVGDFHALIESIQITVSE